MAKNNGPAEGENEVGLIHSAEKARPGRTLFVLGVIAMLLFAAFLQYSAFKKGFYSISADESAQTIAAYRWSKQGLSIPVEVWLPGYPLVLGLGLKVWPDLMVTPRVINNILGLLTLLELGWLAWILFKNRWTVLLTLLLGAAFGPRIVCSVVPLNMILFGFLLIGGIAFLARWLDKPRPALLLIGAGLTTLSAGVRYEGWLFAAGMGLMSLLTIRKQRLAGIRHRMSLSLGTCAILCAVPVAWVILLAVQGHNLWEVFTGSARIHALAEFRAGSFRVLWNHGPFFQLFSQNLESLNIFGVFGVLSFGIFSRNLRNWLFLSVFAFVVLGILALGGIAVPAHNYWRTSLIWSLLLIPFSAYWIIGQGKNLGQGRKYLASAVCLVFASLFLFSFCRQATKMTKYSNMDRPDINAGKFLGSYMSRYQKDDRPLLFIEWAGWHFVHVMVASQCPDTFSSVHMLRRIVKRNRIDLVKLRRHRIGLLIIEVKSFYSRRYLFRQWKPAYMNARWVVLQLPASPES